MSKAPDAPDAQCEVVVTTTGARAMRDRATGELMHPVVGPLVEAAALYVGPSRLEERLRAGAGLEPLVLFEVGLGAGSNAVAAWEASERVEAPARRLEIVSFENNLAALRLALAAEHAPAFGLEGDAGRAARTLLDVGLYETPRTRWRLVVGELPATLDREAAASADLVFWDPFSPRANPVLWTHGAFAALRRCCRAGTTVHTYSAATAVRSALLLAGFVVGAGAPTPLGKTTTLAAVDAADVPEPLDRRWLERVSRSSAPFPSDAPADAFARLSALPQLAR